MSQSWTALAKEVERSANLVRVDQSERQDLVQEALLRVWERLESEGGLRPANALVRTVLRRLKIDHWRKARVRVELEPHEPAGPGPGPSQVLEERELAATLRRHVRALPEEQQEVVRLRIEDGLTFREIAERQGVPLGTALGRMHLAMKRMRRELEVPE